MISRYDIILYFWSAKYELTNHTVLCRLNYSKYTSTANYS